MPLQPRTPGFSRQEREYWAYQQELRKARQDDSSRDEGVSVNPKPKLDRVLLVQEVIYSTLQG